MLMWASGRAEAEALVLAWNRRRDNEHDLSFELFSAENPDHHLGSARVVSLTLRSGRFTEVSDVIR